MEPVAHFSHHYHTMLPLRSGHPPHSPAALSVLLLSFALCIYTPFGISDCCTGIYYSWQLRGRVTESMTSVPILTRSSLHFYKRLQMNRVDGWGSKFRMTECRTTNISKFKNCQCERLREVQLFDFVIYEIIFSFLKYVNSPIFYNFPNLIFFEFLKFFLIN